MSDNPLQPLSDEQVEGVAGGYLYYADGVPYENRWEVIDEKGDVVARFGYWEDVMDYVAAHGIDCREITWEELKRLRETGSID